MFSTLDVRVAPLGVHTLGSQAKFKVIYKCVSQEHINSALRLQL